jgi:hypothetical protein
VGEQHGAPAAGLRESAHPSGGRPTVSLFFRGFLSHLHHDASLYSTPYSIIDQLADSLRTVRVYIQIIYTVRLEKQQAGSSMYVYIRYEYIRATTDEDEVIRYVPVLIN